ncbi:type II toxin-antitoxin system VapC family toxin [Actinokineospora cianjurensis]|uniref:Ribonuclease VapC n=1 Tax=Actinokineospora cianjurensis TaxID=585224 RepID=A0A421B8A7_9PSEU|nr:type II toxin-antitoxin system VapC family toxin [Actinokineospora cianjurensis]RLK60752.1 hypothetical protein CLV68_1265 [Actinokineospora cianjurensis]
MTLLYADTSAVVRAYAVGETDHETLRALLFEGPDPVVTSELTTVEFASAVSAAARTGRVDEPHRLIARFTADCAEGGPVSVLRLVPESVLPTARRLVTEHAIRTLDALHLAVLLTTATSLASGDDIVLVSRDRQQLRVAAELGIAVA